MKFMYSILVSCLLFIGQAQATNFSFWDATSFSPELVHVQAANIGVPVGTVIAWSKEQVPDGWLECDGQPISEMLYPDLHALMPHTPNYKGRFLQGLLTGESIGKEKEAGLPNITGHWDNSRGNWQSAGFSGAIYQGTSRHGSQAGRYWGSDNTWKLMFDASRVNPIYGKSNTVQPPAVTVKYIIKAE